jgi:RimJ/RimL family protein N-acetyltransferase
VSDIILETARLTLRRLTLADVDNMFSIIGNAEAMRYYPKVYSRDDAVQWVERQLKRYEVSGGGLLGCNLKSSGEFVGVCGASFQEVENVWELEVGYLFVPAHWHHGYATEAARACIDFGFKHYTVKHIISLIRPVNEPSWLVARRNGLKLVAYKWFHDYVHGVWKINRP